MNFDDKFDQWKANFWKQEKMNQWSKEIQIMAEHIAREAFDEGRYWGIKDQSYSTKEKGEWD